MVGVHIDGYHPIITFLEMDFISKPHWLFKTDLIEKRSGIEMRGIYIQCIIIA